MTGSAIRPASARQQSVKIWGVSVQELVSENEVTIVLVVLAGWMLLFMGLTDVGEAAAKLERSGQSPSSRQWEAAKADVARKKSHYASMGFYYFLTAGAILCLGVHLVYSSAARRRTSLPFQAQGNLIASALRFDGSRMHATLCHVVLWVPAVSLTFDQLTERFRFRSSSFFLPPCTFFSTRWVLRNVEG